MSVARQMRRGGEIPDFAQFSHKRAASQAERYQIRGIPRPELARCATLVECHSPGASNERWGDEIRLLKRIQPRRGRG
jgi:hypothetical protein